MKYKFFIKTSTGKKFAREISTGIEIHQDEEPLKYAKLVKARKAYIARKEREDVMETCGLTKCKSASGKVFWE